jgi:tripartite-type tricarboxylate transporter receptor subunit TctC
MIFHLSLREDRPARNGTTALLAARGTRQDSDRPARKIAPDQQAFDGERSAAMRRGRTARMAVALAAMVVFASAAQTWAQGYTDRTIKFVVGFGAGGPTDIVARVLAEQLSAALGQKVIVENKTGASGNIATQAVAASPADGTTFLIGASPIAVNHTLFPDFPVRFGRDFVAVAPIGATANVLVVHPSLNVRTLADFIRHVRERPSAVTFATMGRGSSSDLAGVAFDARAGTKMRAVNYRGGGEAAKDVLGGHVHAWFASIPSVLDAIRSGQLVAIATTGPERVSWLPDIPTVAESGFPGFDVRLWVGLFAPAGVPEDRLRAVEAATTRAMAAQDMQATLVAQGISPFPMSRAQFSEFVQSEIDRWRGVLGTPQPQN